MEKAMNYHKLMEQQIASIKKENPTLLLHACCAPCASYVLSLLSEFFQITVFYCNPNIHPFSEYEKRKHELIRLCREMPSKNAIIFTEDDYSDTEFYSAASEYSSEPEGGLRCNQCIGLRMDKTAKAASAGGYDFFATTLSVSPHKNAEMINSIGSRLSELYNTPYLFSDFKKNDGFKKSIELSKQYELYRQNYCGCIYSLR